nr:transcription factor Sox-21-A-like [Hydra vulgaris]
MQSTSKVVKNMSLGKNKKEVTKQSYSFNPITHLCENVLSQRKNVSSQETAIKEKIKRPMSSFLLWAKVTRKNYLKKNPHMHNSEVSKLLGYTWNQMSAIEKLPFTTQAKNLRTVHMTNHPKYCYSTKNLNNNDIAKNPNLKSYGYLQNAYIAQNTVAATKCISSNDVNDYSSDVSFNNIENMLPLNEDPLVDFNKSNKFNIESDKEICEESTTLHYHPNQVQLHFDNQYKNSNEKETNQTYEKEINKDIVEYDNELLM